MTRERFELELLKIKASVPPDHVGFRGGWCNNDGATCLMGEMGRRFGGKAWCFPGIGEFFQSAQNAQLYWEIVELNDAGMPWHQIIDHVLGLAPPAELPPDEHEALQPVDAPLVEEPELVEVWRPKAPITNSRFLPIRALRVWY